jgi:transcriptional regulator with GAF, ATPase, and Fis domain
MGAVYLSCQLGGLLATALAAADHPEQARRYADEALRISKKNGYKPLEAKAMLARGLAGASTREKEEWFSKSYKAATTIGMPELIAESAYRLGALMLESGRGALARDYLLKSTVTTSEMAEQLPIKYRAKYLAEPWRREARKRLQDCVQTIDFTRPSIADVEASGGELFRALYRISVAASDAADVDAFVTAVADVLENLPTTESAVVTLTRGDQTYWRAAGTGLTDELKARVTTAGETARKEARFGGKDWKIFGTAITWIPLDTQQTTGGIYLSRTAKAPPPAEREIEFVTTLGALVSSTIDRIATRPKSAPVKLANRQEATFGIVGSSRAIRDVTSQIELAAASAASTLIEGETGTGKELVARAIHMAGSRSSGPFVPVDCGAIPETLIESELFGAARGAYTGATTDRAGLFETAHKGTLFLDEIGNMPQALQVKLLRVLQEREVRRIGDNKVRSIDIRLITATNGNLTALVEAGTFRQDLFYRINVLKIALPPLRERRGDIPQLAAHFLELLNKRHKTRKHFADEAFESTAAYRFPGNIRELQNLIERAYFSESGSMISSILPETARPNDTAHERPTSEALNTWLNELTEGRRDFWTGVHDRYRRRDISRETLLALFDVGLRRTKGSYRKLASLFRMDRADYRRMMDFLRRNDCVLDFRPYRKLAAEL